VHPVVRVAGTGAAYGEQDPRGRERALRSSQPMPRFSRLHVMQVVVLGTGRRSLEAQVKALELPGVAGVVKFSTPLAHLITAGQLLPATALTCGAADTHFLAIVGPLAHRGAHCRVLNKARTSLQGSV
jgi:hypothetical protein